MVKVKICGITNAADALLAASEGADALGFVFYKASPRAVAPDEAGRIIRLLPPFVATVGVFVDQPAAEVAEAVKASGVRVLQFHGGETPEYCRSFGMPFIKAFRVKDLDSLSCMEHYKGATAFLLDAYSEEAFGGTGLTFNWDAAVYAKRFGQIILAGGLTPENVGKAVEHVKPYAVDVSSGVESDKGKKDHAAVRQFIAAAKSRRLDAT